MRTQQESRSERDEGFNGSFGVNRKKAGFRDAICRKATRCIISLPGLIWRA